MLKYIFYAVFVLIIVIIGIVFLSRNEAEVAVDFLFGQALTFGVGLWVLGSFIVGCLVAWLISWPSHIAVKAVNKKNSRKLKSLQDEILRLKGETTKGN